MLDGNIGVAIGSSAVTAICGVIGLWIRARFQRTKIEPDPLNVNKTEKYITRGECKNYRCALEKRIDEFGPALERIFKKLNENDQKSEARSTQLHRRLDPIIEKTAAHQEAISLIKGVIIGEKSDQGLGVRS